MDVITFPVNGLSILLRCVISLPDATSYDNNIYFMPDSEFNAYRQQINMVFSQSETI